MGVGRFIVNTGSKVADYCAFGLQNRHYWHLFNRDLGNFEGANDQLSEKY